MKPINSYLPKEIRRILLGKFLKRHGVKWRGLPNVGDFRPIIKNSGQLLLGSDCSFRTIRLPPNVTVKKGAVLKIGDRVFINDGVNICASGSIEIGNDVKIGDMSYLYDSDFHELEEGRSARVLPIKIGNNVWIGAHCILLPGTTIGDDSVVAAGAVVTRPIGPRCLAAGIPAKVIKELNVESSDWVRT
jgi:maltose O-acetyltransferase